MFKQKMILEVRAHEDRIHRLECPPEAPLGEVYDAIQAMKAYVINQINVENEAETKETKCEKKCETEVETTTTTATTEATTEVKVDE